MGSWWNVEVGGEAVPIWGKSYVPDELMLLFTDADRCLDSVKAEAFADHMNRDVDGPEDDSQPSSWTAGVMGYETTAGVLRQRLDLHGFSRDWVCRLSAAFFDDQDRDRSDPSPEGADAYENGEAITAALTTRFGRAAGAGRAARPGYSV